MRLGLSLAVVLAVVGSVILAQAWFPDLAAWAVEQQRAFQNEIALGVHALRAGDPGALVLLVSAAAAYGFVHAVGPGHGKFLVGGVGLGSHITARRLFGIGMAASIAQSIWAIILVYGGFWILQTSAQSLTSATEDYLAPASYLTIGVVGAVMVWRGTRNLSRAMSSGGEGAKEHRHGSCGCPSHQLDREEIARLRSPRQVIALILSVAVRPCTGAILLLVIAWQLDLVIAGAVAVVAMGLGTGLLVSLVAVSSVKLRGLVHFASNRAGATPFAAPCLQLFAGGMIVWFSVSILHVSTVFQAS